MAADATDTLGSNASVDATVSPPAVAPLRKLSLLVDPGVGRSILPAELPWFTLREYWANGAIDTIGTAFDPSPTLSSYEIPHLITLDLSSFMWRPTEGNVYVAELHGERDGEPGLRATEWICE